MAKRGRARRSRRAWWPGRASASSRTRDRRRSPRRARTPAPWRWSLARSAHVITNAPAPSVTRQQSSRCSGDACMGEASTSSTVIGLLVARAGSWSPTAGCSTAIWASCSDVVPYIGHVPAGGQGVGAHRQPQAVRQLPLGHRVRGRATAAAGCLSAPPAACGRAGRRCATRHATTHDRRARRRWRPPRARRGSRSSSRRRRFRRRTGGARRGTRPRGPLLRPRGAGGGGGLPQHARLPGPCPDISS